MHQPEQILLFSLCGTTYGVDSDLVIQILRVPEITPVPFTDPALRGICSVEGSILNVFDGNLLLDEQEEPIDPSHDHSRVLTIRYEGFYYGLLIEEVFNNVSASEYDYEMADDENRAVSAIMKKGQEIIQVIHLPMLASTVQPISLNSHPIKEGIGQDEEQMSYMGEAVKYLFFRLGDEQYGIEADFIREIISFDGKITDIAESVSWILGMITIRGQVVTVIDLGKILEMDSANIDEGSILLLQYQGRLLGLLVDDIIDIKDIYPEKEIETLPEMYQKGRFKGICKLHDQLVTLISSSFALSLLDQTEKYNQSNTTVTDNEQQNQDIRELVAFYLSGAEYSIPLEQVDEIIKYNDVTIPPAAPDLIKGIINLRGKIIPIISLHHRMKEQEEIGEDTKIIVFHESRITAGFIVDSVSEVMHIPCTHFKPSDNQDQIIPELVLLEQGRRIISHLDLQHLIQDEKVRAFQTDWGNTKGFTEYE